jgi:hypothetical protein
VVDVVVDVLVEPPTVVDVTGTMMTLLDVVVGGGTVAVVVVMVTATLDDVLVTTIVVVLLEEVEVVVGRGTVVVVVVVLVLVTGTLDDVLVTTTVVVLLEDDVVLEDDELDVEDVLVVGRMVVVGGAEVLLLDDEVEEAVEDVEVDDDEVVDSDDVVDTLVVVVGVISPPQSSTPSAAWQPPLSAQNDAPQLTASPPHAQRHPVAWHRSRQRCTSGQQASTAPHAHTAPLPEGAPTQSPGSVGPPAGSVHAPRVVRRATTGRVPGSPPLSVPSRLLRARSIATRKTSGSVTPAHARRPRHVAAIRAPISRPPAIRSGRSRTAVGGQVTPIAAVRCPWRRSRVIVRVSSNPGTSGSPTT